MLDSYKQMLQASSLHSVPVLCACLAAESGQPAARPFDRAFLVSKAVQQVAGMADVSWRHPQAAA